MSLCSEKFQYKNDRMFGPAVYRKSRYNRGRNGKSKLKYSRVRYTKQRPRRQTPHHHVIAWTASVYTETRINPKARGPSEREPAAGPRSSKVQRTMRKNGGRRDQAAKLTLQRLKINLLLKHRKRLRIFSVLYGNRASKQHVSNFALFKIHVQLCRRKLGLGDESLACVWHINLQCNRHLLLLPFTQTRVLFLESTGTVHFSNKDPELRYLFDHKAEEKETTDLMEDMIEEYGREAHLELQTFDLVVEDYRVFNYNQERTRYIELYVCQPLSDDQKKSAIMQAIMIQRALKPDVFKNTPTPCSVLLFIDGDTIETIWHRPDKALLLSVKDRDTGKIIEYGVFPCKKYLKREGAACFGTTPGTPDLFHRC